MNRRGAWRPAVAALLAILLMSAFDLGGVNESAGVLFDSLLAGL